MRFADTIVALITGPPPAAVAWIRLSGPDAFQIAHRIFRPFPLPPPPRLATYGSYANLEDGLAVAFPEGHSYTGEPTVELSMHGSRASVETVLAACRAAGARDAEAGEFTLRAFMNGRIDLTQAEAVKETCDALTEVQLRAAGRMREGQLSQSIAAMRNELFGMLAAVEASVDFSEEIGEVDRPAMSARVASLRESVRQLIGFAEGGRILRDGLRVAIVGPPNAGKSSLMNALLGTERSIVTDIPGTTRDFVEERLDVQGMVLVLIDTAGIREAADDVEAIGIQRSRALAAHADEIWFVYDALVGFAPSDLASFGERARLIANKCDLGDPRQGGMAVSARSGTGLDELLQSLRGAHDLDIGIPINTRHRGLLERVAESLDELQQALAGDAPDDLLSVLLNQAISQLGEITGETAAADMLDRIFRDFCIGK